MQRAAVYRNRVLAGVLTKKDDRSYIFKYDYQYFNNPNNPAISLTLPKTKQEYHSNTLFPFFFNILSEGVNKQLQCRQLQIDENDSYSLLVATSQNDTIGAVTITPLKD